MTETDTVTTSSGCLGGILNSIVGALVGIVMFLGSIATLFMNEGCSVRKYRTIEFARKNAVSVAEAKISPQNEGKVVHVAAEAKAGMELKDEEGGIGRKGLALRRAVEMYQWDESSSSKKQAGGGRTTTYSYKTTWASREISSDHFKEPNGHRNPASWPMKSRNWTAQDATLGDYKLAPDLIEDVDATQPLPVTQEQAAGLPPALAAKAKAAGDWLFIGVGTLENPQVGDIRVKWNLLPEGPLTVVATQTGNSFTPFHSAMGSDQRFIRPGHLSLMQVVEAEKHENSVRTWILRGVGLFAMFLGGCMMLGPISRMLDVIPFVGNVAEVGIMLASLVVTLSVGLGTIALAWIFVRPVLAGGILAAVVGLLVWHGKRRRARKMSLPQPPPMDVPPPMPQM